MTDANGTSTTLHGVLMQVHGVGVLLTGASGVGKSELALELITRGHQLIADDAPEFHQRDGTLYGHCPPLLQGFLEARSLGILNIGKLYGPRALRPSTTLQLIIALDNQPQRSDSGIERLQGHRDQRCILGITVDEISIPIRLGHNLAVLVEAATRDHSLRKSGYRADDDMTQRQLREICQQTTRAAH